MSDITNRIIEISYKYNLGHVGSCLTAGSIIDEIYGKMKEGDKFILSSGHAGLALYCVLEKYYTMQHGHYGINAVSLLEKHGVHPNRDLDNAIYASTGSLGQGLPIALGMALADRKRNVYCLISDGECAEGSIWEALRIKVENHVDNLKVYVNANGWGAYGEVNIPLLKARLLIFDPQVNFIHSKQEFITGQEAHYLPLTKEQYEKTLL